MSLTEYGHIPVLLEETIEALRIKPESRLIDCTLGLGGHTEAMLQCLGLKGRILALDRDPDMLARAKDRLKTDPRITFVHGNFADLEIFAAENGFNEVDGILADLGVSSVHFDEASRGFSFQHDGPLDMRFDPKSGRKSAQEIINSESPEQLAWIFQTFGEERFANRIAKKISILRKQKEIQTTRELAEIVRSCVPPTKQKLHPATKVFQALRIYINDELGALTRMLGTIQDILVPGGRVAIISYHSLEDRYIKKNFRDYARHCICPPADPQCTCGARPRFLVVTKKPIIPTVEEINRNPRSRSAKLRVLERL